MTVKRGPIKPAVRRRTRSNSANSASAFMQKSAELGLAAPQVVAHRVARMALAGPVPSARDQAEFKLMWAEKSAAFTQGWQAMAAQVTRQQQAAVQSAVQAAGQAFWVRAFNPWAAPWAASTGASGLSWAATAAGMGPMLDILHAGLKPVHQKAVSNAKRLQQK